MPDRCPDDNSGDVDFVVGPDGPVDATLTRTTDHRQIGKLQRRLSLGAGAAVLAVALIIARTIDGHPDNTMTKSTASSIVADSPLHILNPFQLATRTAAARGDCPFATTCSSAPTSKEALAAVSAAFDGVQISSSYTWVGVANGRFGPSLLSRTITARTSTGTLTVDVRRHTSGESPHMTRGTESRITVMVVSASVDGFAVTVQLVQHSSRNDVTGAINSLAHDERLLVTR